MSSYRVWTGARAQRGAFAAGWRCHLCEYVVPPNTPRPGRVRLDHLRSHGVEHVPELLNTQDRARFMRDVVVKASLAVRESLSLAFHEFWVEHFRPEGAHALMIRGRSDKAASIRATCSKCRRTGPMWVLRRGVCNRSITSKAAIDRSLKTANLQWMEQQRSKLRIKKRQDSAARGIGSNHVAFCSSLRIGEADHPGPH